MTRATSAGVQPQSPVINAWAAVVSIQTSYFVCCVCTKQTFAWKIEAAVVGLAVCQVGPKSLRRKNGKKPGGQPGHPGVTLALVDNPNERKRHEPGPCTGCGTDLSDAPEAGMERWQVFDLPPMTVRVTEHRDTTR